MATNPETFDEFMSRMVNAFPDATVEEDNEGQMIIYTGLKEDAGRKIVEFEPEEG